MWEAIDRLRKGELDAGERAYRRWARARLRSGRLMGFIVMSGDQPVASGCVWLMRIHPRPHRPNTIAAYLLSMYTEPGHRRKGHGARIVRAAIRWAKSQGIEVMLLHASRFGERIYLREGFRRTTEMRLILAEWPRSSRKRKAVSAQHPSR